MNCLHIFKLIRHRTSLFHISAARYSSQHPIKFLETQDRWREKDGMSQRWQLIYKAPLEPTLNFLTMYLTFTTSTITCCGLYYAAFCFDKTTMNDPVILGDDVVIANSSTEYLVYIGSFILFHVAVKVLLSKYVIRLYQDGDDYVAIFRGHFYNSIKKHQFHLNEFKKLSPTFVVSWGDSRYSLGGKHAIILDNYFKTPSHFNYLLNKKCAHHDDDDN